MGLVRESRDQGRGCSAGGGRVLDARARDRVHLAHRHRDLRPMSLSTVKVLITDLDNTLYDWVGFFAKSLAAMIDETVRLIECDPKVLKQDLQAVHRRYRDPERPYALLETVTVRAYFSSDEEARQTLAPAFMAFSRERRKHLHCYPGVVKTLESLKSVGVPIIAHTEANAIQAIRRLEKLDLLKFFHSVYALDSDLEFRSPPPLAVHRVPESLRKPNPKILDRICNELHVGAKDALYVGDSLARDIGMARLAGLRCAWASYGTRHSDSDWSLVVEVSHWSAEDIQRAAKAQEALGNTNPDAVLTESFAELLVKFDFENGEVGK